MSSNYFLQTKRIGFSLWQEQDLKFAQLLWSNQQVTKYIHKNGIFTMQEIEERFELERNNLKQFGYCYYMIFDLSNDKFIGCCGLRKYNEAIVEIGFHLLPAYWYQKFAIEAASCMIHYAFTTLQVEGIFAGHHPENIKSQKVLERLHFEFWKKEYYQPTNLYHPSYLLMKEEYLKWEKEYEENYRN